MGLFSSKTKTYVGTSASRLIEDDRLPDSVFAGATRGILQAGDIPGSIIEELSAGFAFKAERMYSFSENGYVFGSPSGDYLTSARGGDVLEGVLVALEDAAVEIEYAHLDSPNILHIGWFKLQRDHGYDPMTNKLAGLSAAKGTDVFLHDLVVEIPTGTLDNYSPVVLQQWGRPPKSGASPSRPSSMLPSSSGNLAAFSPLEQVAEATDAARAIYAWVDPATKEVKQDSLRITNDEFDEQGSFMQARYRTSSGDVRYFLYELGTGTYPGLDALLTLTPTAGGNYFPFIHFRAAKASIDTPAHPEWKEHSVKMAEKLGFDWNDVHDAIHENPDIGVVEQAFLAMMVPVASTSEVERRYLFDFFNRMHDNLGPGIQTSTSGSQVNGQSPLRLSEVVQDTLAKIVIGNSGLDKVYVVGSIGPVGAHDSGHSIGEVVENGELTLSGRRMGFGATLATGPYHYFRRQVSANVFHEIRVSGLQTRYWVAGDYYASSDGDAESPVLLIPVDRSIARNYSMKVREELYSRSLHVICNSLQTQKVKWYQQGWFGTMLKLVAVVLFVYSLGTSSAISAALATAGSTLTVIAAVALTLLVEALVAVVVAYAFKFVAKVVGTELALLLAVVAAVTAISAGYQAGGLSKSVTAQTALQVSTGLVKGVNANTADAMRALQEEMDVLKTTQTEKMELLEQAQALLDSNLRLDPLVIFGEKPDEYFNRTVHAGNIGTIAYASVQHFVDVALTLPRISDTAQGFSDEAFV